MVVTVVVVVVMVVVVIVVVVIVVVVVVVVCSFIDDGPLSHSAIVDCPGVRAGRPGLTNTLKALLLFVCRG